MKTQLLTLIALMLFGAKATFGQELIVFENTKPEAYLVRHQADGLRQPIANFFLSTLSKGNNKPLAQTEFILVHDEFLRMTKLNASQYQVFATLKNFRITGDTRYRGFDMGQTLLPTHVKYSIERLNSQGQVLESWDFNSVKMSGNTVIIANFKGTDSTQTFPNTSLRVRDKSFVYNKGAKLPFTNLVATIDEYYQAGPELEGLYTELRKIDPMDMDHLDEQETNLNALLAQCELLRKANYPQRLQLSAQNDPANFLGQFSEIDAYGQELAANLANTRRNLPSLYHQRGLAALNNNDRPAAVTQFNLALQEDPNFTPALLELARVSYQEGDAANASSKLLKLFKGFQMDEATRNSALALAKTIYENDLGNAAYAVKQDRFADALAELRAASKLCEGIKGLTCSLQLEMLENQAHLGIYQQLLATGSRLLQSGDLAAAEDSTRQAIALQKAVPGAIANAAEAQALLVQVMAAQYAVLITEGQDLESSGKHRLALDRYVAAQALEAPYGFKPNAKLPEMAQRTAKVLVLADIQLALQQAQNNRLREARETQNKLFQMRKQYVLETDAKVETAYKQLKAAIFDQECNNAQMAYDQALVQAQGEVQAKRFIEAVTAFDAALAIDAQNGACGLDVSIAREGKAKVIRAAQYQTQNKAIQTLVDRLRFREAIDGHLAAENFHNENNIAEKFGLSHTDLFAFIRKSGRKEFKRFGAEYFTNLEGYEKAIDLLTDILSQGYRKSKLKPLMVRIGSELAVRDYKQMPDANAKAIVLTYTKGNKSLKKLYKAYIKQWKRL